MVCSNANSPMSRLRAVTHDLHVAAERGSFGRAVVERKLSLSDYTGQLAAYRIILRTLEARLMQEPDARVRGVFVPSMTRVPQLESDLRQLRVTHGMIPAATQLAAANYVRHLDNRVVGGAQLLGHLYVFEGSRLGCGLLLPRLESSLGLTADVSSFYRGLGPDTRSHWEAFASRMDLALSGAHAFDRAAEAARDAYRRVTGLLDDVFLLSRPRQSLEPDRDAVERTGS